MTNLDDLIIEGDIGAILVQEFGINYDFTKIHRSRNLQKRMRYEHLILCARTEIGEFDGEAFAHKLNNLTERYFKLIGRVLGEEDYQTIFGESIDIPVKLVDPKVASKINYNKAI